MASHNERIAAKRQKVCMQFMQTTSTNLSTAKHYLQQTAFDLERAVSTFYDAGGEALSSDDEQEDVAAETNTNDANNNISVVDDDDKDGDPVSVIMKAAKEATPAESSSSSFGGRGMSLNSSSTNRDKADNDSPTTLRVRVVFYKDGFTAQEEEEEVAKEPQSRQRRLGVHSISSSSSTESIRLPPLQDYKENQQFIKDVQENKVPVEFRRLDSQNRPIPVSITLADFRTREYPVEEWKKQQEQQSKMTGSYHGTGQTLGGGGENSVSNQPNTNNSNTNFLIALLLSWWNILIAWLTNWFRSVIIPLKKHTVDPQKTTTTISIRMPSKRERVEFNTDHTVEDLRRYCQIELNDITSNFEIMAGFPPRTIAISKQTLSEAGLLNSAVEIRVVSSQEHKRKN